METYINNFCIQKFMEKKFIENLKIIFVSFPNLQIEMNFYEKYLKIK
jgi:hypothetical protein